METNEKDPPVEVNCSPECAAGIVETMGGKQPADFTVTSAKISGMREGGVVIEWETVSAGFGELTLWVFTDGSIEMDTECMSREFVKAVLAKLVDQATERGT